MEVTKYWLVKSEGNFKNPNLADLRSTHYFCGWYTALEEERDPTGLASGTCSRGSFYDKEITIMLHHQNLLQIFNLGCQVKLKLFFYFPKGEIMNLVLFPNYS